MSRRMLANPGNRLATPSATSSSSSMNGYLPSERQVKEQTISFYLFGPTLLWCDWEAYLSFKSIYCKKKLMYGKKIKHGYVSKTVKHCIVGN